ncbi:hypothetical protein [Streptomyces sp. NBC_01465]|uniref:hypothetical protein n=1 Tax=Streptomyces sp. NBC_01465 TaxID=2903878 RepID=UPI002E36024F|nr:hypothetical protein [Streptomyces sp. NBC_01465]
MRVVFEVPPFFQEITPGLDPDAAHTAAITRLGARAAALSEQELDETVTTYRLASQTLADTGVFYAATCLGTINGDGSMGTLTLARQPLTYRDARIAAEGIAEIMTSRRPGGTSTVEMLGLPCGEAVLVFDRTAALRIPAELTEYGADIPIDVAQLQAFVPVPQQTVPGAQELVVVTFGTPSTDHWADYCEIMAALLRTLRFTPGDSLS